MLLGPTGSLHPSFTIDGQTDAVKAKAMIGHEEDTLYAYLSSESLFIPETQSWVLRLVLGFRSSEIVPRLGTISNRQY